MSRTVLESDARAVGARMDSGLVPSRTSQGGQVLSLHGNEQMIRRLARLRKSVWASGHLHKLGRDGFRPPVCWFVTLTYADAFAWRADHISAAVERFRQWCRRAGVECRYTWVAEIQSERLARTGDAVMHYHLLAWLPHGVRMPFWDRAQGRRPSFWGFGWTNTQEAVSGVGYLMKYLSKLGEFHRFPRGARLYGIGGLDHSARAVRSWLNWPQWAKAAYGVGELVRAGSRLVVRASGEVLSSPWRVSVVPGALWLRAVGEIPERWFSGPYSSVSF